MSKAAPLHLSASNIFSSSTLSSSSLGFSLYSLAISKGYSLNDFIKSHRRSYISVLLPSFLSTMISLQFSRQSSSIRHKKFYANSEKMFVNKKKFIFFSFY